MNTSSLARAALVSTFVLASAGCAARSSSPLSYPGDDARNVSDALANAISQHGHMPVCKTGRFCKFEYNERGTVHFKLKKTGVVLAVDLDEDGLEPTELSKMQAEMNTLAREIWKDASKVALDKEKEAKRVEAERRAAERAQEEAQREANALARAEADRAAAEQQAQVDADKAEADRVAALQVWDSVGFERLPRGAAMRVEQPEGAICRIQGDASWTQAKQLEVPFQLDAARGTFYTFDCELGGGVVWHKKLQAKDGYVSVVRLSQGKPVR
jgi:hypothetical protein